MITRHGVAALVLAASSFAIGRVFGLIELHIIGTGLVAVVLIAALTVGLRPVDVTIARHPTPARPDVGTDAHVQLTITARRRSPLLELWEPVNSDIGAAMRVAPLRRDATARAAYTIPTARRGLVTVGPLSAELQDPFGLTRRRRWIAPRHTIVVRPRTVALPLPTVGESDGPLVRRLVERARRTSGADEFRSLREYVPGDDLRRVHWGASARRGNLVVRECDPGADLRLLVVLDLDPRSYADREPNPVRPSADPDDALDLAVAATASLAVSASAAGRPMTLTTTDAERLDVSPIGLDATLDRLASVSFSTVPTTGTGSADRRSGATAPLGGALVVAVIVTGPFGADRALRLASADGPVDAIVVITCTGRAGDLGAATFVLAPQDLAHLEREWSGLVGPPRPAR